jgi:acetylglutamate kinase
MKEQQPVIVFKYGGNAMTDEHLKRDVLRNICSLKEQGYDVVVVHGGGPFIKQALQDAGILSEFIDGHRKTPPETYEHVEMALKGKVNGSLVSIINSLGHKAVGLSGKDGKIVTATKRLHQTIVKGKPEDVDLGQVGDVEKVDTTLIEILISNDFIPVITCLASDESGISYNINGDMFAGHLAGALKAAQYVVLTDVDGLRKDKDDPASLMHRITLSETRGLLEDGVIQGGMIPKIESCEIALNKGARAARIINGTKPDQVLQLKDEQDPGTIILK